MEQLIFQVVLSMTLFSIAILIRSLWGAKND